MYIVQHVGIFVHACLHALNTSQFEVRHLDCLDTVLVDVETPGTRHRNYFINILSSSVFSSVNCKQSQQMRCINPAVVAHRGPLSVHAHSPPWPGRLLL